MYKKCLLLTLVVALALSLLACDSVTTVEEEQEVVEEEGEGKGVAGRAVEKEAPKVVEEEEEASYALTIAVDGEGSTDPIPGTYTYDEGSRATIAASASSGWEFDRWSGDVSGTSPTISLDVDADKSVTAHFSELPATRYSLTVRLEGQGTTSPSLGSHTYDEGTRVSITASPSSGWEFDRWGGDASGTSTSLTMTMNSDKSIIAHFSGVIVTFSDPNLEAAIREAIDKATGAIYVSDLQGLTHLSVGDETGVGDNAIKDLTGLEHCTGLTSLILANHEIRDVSPLASLTNLLSLNLGGNPIDDISPLAHLSGLRSLLLWGTQVRDISPLVSLTGLTRLYLTNCQIQDISPIASLTRLSKIDLHGNQIVDIAPLASLTNLNEVLLTQNQIEDISALVENQGLAAGDTVIIRDNPLTDRSRDVYIPQLEQRGVIVK